jgi:Tfp pilus assembly protein PilF
VMSDLAISHAMLNQFEEAASLYEHAFADNPADFYMLEQAATWRIKARDVVRAEKYLDMLRRYTPRASSIPELEKQIADLRS